MWRKKYYQWCPMILGFLTASAIVVIFHYRSSPELQISDEEILTSTTLQSICDYPFKYSLLISTGVLIPFMIDEVYGWINGLLPSSIDSYLLPILMIIMQFFNIYWLSQGSTVGHFWDYQMGVRIEVLVLYNIVLALQINLVHHSTTVLHALCISTILFNCGMICKIYSLYDRWSILFYVWIVVWSGSFFCNAYVAYSWFHLYQTAKQQSLACLEHFYAFVMMLVLILFLSLNIILSSIKLAFSFEDMVNVGVIVQQTILLGAFYTIIELNALLLKHQAHSSIDALETKRAFVRYVSHEIRTPLNAACLGLQLLDQEVHKHYAPQQELCTTNKDDRISLSSSKRFGKESFLELVDDITQACNIAMDIVNDLLMYEKIDGGLMALETQETLLIPFVEEVLKLFSVQAKTSNVELILRNNAQQDNIVVKVDRYKMSQVIRNLISNALKFSPVGSKVEIDIEYMCGMDNVERSRSYSFLEHVSGVFHHENSEVLAPSATDIETGNVNYRENSFSSPNDAIHKVFSSSNSLWPSTTHNNEMYKVNSSSSLAHHQPLSQQDHHSCASNPIVRISVKDAGIGISKENQKRLFREIVQFDAAALQQGKGSGIGLWISNKIMKLHGGIIHVFSEGEGHGSTFSINMPVTRSSIAPSASIRIKPSVSVSRSSPYENSHHVFASPSSSSNILNGYHAASPKKPIGDGLVDTTSSTIGKTPSPHVKEQSSAAAIRHHHVPVPCHEAENTYKEIFRNKVENPNLDSPSIALLSPPLASSLSEEPTVKIHHEQQEQEATLEKQSNTHIRRILIVDDSQVNRKMVRNMVKKKFDEYEEAEDGEDALARYHSHSHVANKIKQKQQLNGGTQHPHPHLQHSNYYDVIITDYLMPRMNGLELVKQLRSSGYTGQIIGLTGNTDMQAAFEEAGANHLLTKPVQGKVLLETVQDCCAKTFYQSAAAAVITASC